MLLDQKSIIGAVGVVLAEEKNARLALAVELARLREQVDEYGNVIRQPGPQGERGLDGRHGDAGAQGERGMPGERGIDGAPGERGFAGERGEQGERGMPGERGAPGQGGERGERGIDGARGADGLPGERGERGFAGERGEQGSRGDRGEPGAPGDRGERGEPGMPGYAGSARGLYDPDVTDYRALDVVTLNGSEWRAKVDNPGPLPGPGWMLGAKGTRGKPGDRGPAGPPGPSGIAELVLADFSLIITQADGSALECNLLPLFERYHREVAA